MAESTPSEERALPGKTERRIFAVGDIHGCLGKLDRLMARLPIDPERDLLVFLGDYINRGPESARVIERLIEIRHRVRHTVFLLGNHEYELLEYARTGDIDLLPPLRMMGIETTLDSYGCGDACAVGDLSFLPVEHTRFLAHLAPWHRAEGYLLIHAGVIPGKEPEESPLDRLLTVRHTFLEDDGPAAGPVVVFGHTPFETPFVTPRKIGIDTGAYLGNLLTAVELPRLRFYHA